MMELDEEQFEKDLIIMSKIDPIGDFIKKYSHLEEKELMDLVRKYFSKNYNQLESAFILINKINNHKRDSINGLRKKQSVWEQGY